MTLRPDSRESNLFREALEAAVPRGRSRIIELSSRSLSRALPAESAVIPRTIPVAVRIMAALVTDRGCLPFRALIARLRTPRKP